MGKYSEQLALWAQVGIKQEESSSKEEMKRSKTSKQLLLSVLIHFAHLVLSRLLGPALVNVHSGVFLVHVTVRHQSRVTDAEVRLTEL